MNYFDDFVVSKPEFNLLAVGDQIVRIIRAEQVTSFQQYSGDEKVTLPEWNDQTPQLAITIVSAEEGKSGGLTHRFNGMGYLKMPELSKAQVKSGSYEDKQGYACSLNEDGLLVREKSELHTKECANILNQFAAALGIKEGQKLGKELPRIIADQVTFRVTVINKPYNGKDQLRLTGFKAIGAGVTVKADFED